MLADRASAYGQWQLSLDEALQEEFRGGMAVVQSGETRAGALRFSAGAGRHGDFAE
jgi:enoyl-CoA hydratase